MKNIRAWVQGKPPFLAFFSLLCATGVHDVEEVLSERRSYKLYGHELPEHPGETWLALYRKPFAVHKFVGELAREFAPYGDQANLIGYSLLNFPHVTKSHRAKKLQKQWEELPANEREDLVKFCVTIVSELLELYLVEIEEGIKGIQPTEADRQKFRDKFWERPECTFFLTVWGPCLFFDRTQPHDLYKKAIKGDLSALETLIRLDQKVIHEKKIRAVLTTRKAIQRNILYRALNATCEEKPEKINLKHSVVRSAALISLLSQALKLKLSYAEILKLFDAIAIDFGRDDQEKFLYDDANSFGRAVRKEKAKWLSSFTKKA